MKNDHLQICDIEYIQKNNKPLGIKFTAYDVNSITKTGCFFTVNPQTFELLLEHKTFGKNNEISKVELKENYAVELVLEKIGFDVLQIVIKDENKRPVVYYGDRPCIFGNIENYLSPKK